MCRLLLAISSFFVGGETAPECKHEKRGGQKIGSRSPAAGDRGEGEAKGGHNGIWGRRFLWTLEGSHLALPPSSFTTSTILCLPESQFPALQQSPQESAGPEVSGPVGPATMSASEAATPAPESDILADMQPLRIQLRGTKSLPVPG